MISKSYSLSAPGGGALGSLGADLVSAPVDFRHSLGFSLHVKVTGAPTGTVKLQVSNDDPNAGPQTWADLTGATLALAGAPSETMFNVLSNYCGWYRLAYTRTSGTGTIEAKHLDKRMS